MRSQDLLFDLLRHWKATDKTVHQWEMSDVDKLAVLGKFKQYFEEKTKGNLDAPRWYVGANHYLIDSIFLPLDLIVGEYAEVLEFIQNEDIEAPYPFDPEVRMEFLDFLLDLLSRNSTLEALYLEQKSRILDLENEIEELETQLDEEH